MFLNLTCFFNGKETASLWPGHFRNLLLAKTFNFFKLRPDRVINISKLPCICRREPNYQIGLIYFMNKRLGYVLRCTFCIKYTQPLAKRAVGISSTEKEKYFVVPGFEAATDNDKHKAGVQLG